MKFKKAIAFILAAQMLLMSLAACSDTEDETDAPGTDAPVETSAPETAAPETAAPETAAPETEAPETTLDRLSVPDELPEISFGGADFRFMTNINERYELVTDENTGEGVSNAVWNRNARIEERFDVKITADIASPIQEEYDSQYHIRDLLLTGDYYYDVCSMMQRMSLDLPGNEKGLYNWLEVPYINWDKPWWNYESNEGAIFNDKLWTVTGSLSLSSLDYMFMLAYNMDLFEEFGISSDELHNLVYDGEWTLDKMIEVCSVVYADNGNGVPDVGDTFGFGSNNDRALPWVTSIGEQTLAANEDRTKIEVKLGTEKVYNALEKLVDFTWANKCSLATAGAAGEWINQFNEGNVGMITAQMGYLSSHFADVEFDVGILPFPKYDTAQAEYYSVPYYDFSVYGIPSNISEENLTKVGVIMEALNAESWKTVYYDYYDELLKGRYSADEEVAKMVDLISDSIVYDFAYQPAIWMGHYKVPYVFMYEVQANTKNLASVLAENMSFYEEILAFVRTFWDDDFVPQVEE